MDDEDEDFEQRPTPTRNGSRPRLTDSERARHHRSWARGVPVVRPEPSNESTAPLELLLNGQLDGDDYRQIEALRQSADDVYVLLMNVAKAISRHRDKERSDSKAIERQVLEAINTSAGHLSALRHEIGERHTKTKGSIHENLSELLGTHRTAKWLAGLALAGALSAVTYVITEIKSSGADAVRMNRCEDDIKDIRRDLRRKEP